MIWLCPLASGTGDTHVHIHVHAHVHVHVVHVQCMFRLQSMFMHLHMQTHVVCCCGHVAVPPTRRAGHNYTIWSRVASSNALLPTPCFQRLASNALLPTPCFQRVVSYALFPTLPPPPSEERTERAAAPPPPAATCPLTSAKLLLPHLVVLRVQVLFVLFVWGGLGI